MSTRAKPRTNPPPPPRPIDQLREASKLVTGRVARAFCGRSWPHLRQLLLTQASKMPHRAYLDAELLDAAAPEIARLVQQLDTGLLRYETAADAGQLSRLEIPLARLIVYLIRIFRLSSLLPLRAGQQGMAWGVELPLDHWEARMRQALARDNALRSELSDLGIVVLRVLAAQAGDVRTAKADLPEDAAQASAAHKLKVKIPIIPLFLDYEGEIEMGAKLDLGHLWTRLLDWLRGGPETP